MLDERNPGTRPLTYGTLIFCAVVIAVSWFRWSTFQYGTFDVAFYDQAFWLALQGKWNVSLLDVPLMGNHAEPICFLLLPFYWIWQSPMFFVVVQAIFLATMPFTARRIARTLEFSPAAAGWLALSTLLAPALGFMALHEFHPETLAAPLILLMLEARLNPRPGIYWLWFLLALACKENVALLLAWMCAVHWVLDRKRGREWQAVFNVIPCVTALGWLLLYVLWIGPSLNGGRVDYGELYGHIGGLSGILTSPWRAVSVMWHALFNGNLFWGLVLPFVLLPFLRPRWLVISLPILAQHFLSYRTSEWSIEYHYAAPLFPLMWFASAEAASRLFWRDVMAGWIVAACIACQLWFGPVKSIYHTARNAGDALWQSEWKRAMLASIEQGASVTAGIPYLSHLSKRESLHSLHHVLKGLKTLSRAEYQPPPPTDVVVVDTGDLATFNRFAGYYHPARKLSDGRVIPSSDMLLHAFLSRAEWRPLSRNGFSVYLKNESTPAHKRTATGRRLDDQNSLVAIDPLPPLPDDSMLFSFTWDVAKGRTWLPWASLYLRNADGNDYAIGKGPVLPGRENGRFSEAWSVRPPPGTPPGKYRGILLIYDSFEFDLPPGTPHFERRTFDLGEFELR